jgi:hypothetical protein
MSSGLFFGDRYPETIEGRRMKTLPNSSRITFRVIYDDHHVNF